MSTKLAIRIAIEEDSRINIVRERMWHIQDERRSWRDIALVSCSAASIDFLEKLKDPSQTRSNASHKDVRKMSTVSQYDRRYVSADNAIFDQLCRFPPLGSFYVWCYWVSNSSLPRGRSSYRAWWAAPIARHHFWQVCRQVLLDIG